MFWIWLVLFPFVFFSLFCFSRLFRVCVCVFFKPNWFILFGDYKFFRWVMTDDYVQKGRNAMYGVARIALKKTRKIVFNQDPLWIKCLLSLCSPHSTWNKRPKTVLKRIWIYQANAKKGTARNHTIQIVVYGRKILAYSSNGHAKEKKRSKRRKTNKPSNYLCAEMMWSSECDVYARTKTKQKKTVLFVGVCVWQCDSVIFQFVFICVKKEKEKTMDKVPLVMKKWTDSQPNTEYHIFHFNFLSRFIKIR